MVTLCEMKSFNHNSYAFIVHELLHIYTYNSNQCLSDFISIERPLFQIDGFGLKDIYVAIYVRISYKLLELKPV